MKNMILLTALLSVMEAFSQEEPWRDLFNGQNLVEWRVHCVPEDRGKDFWTVEDGMIVCNSVGSTDHQYVWLEYQEDFKDFELRLKFQSVRGTESNSGIQARSRYDENAVIDGDAIGWLDGPQVDLNPSTPWRSGLIYDETREHRRWINPSLPNWEIDEQKHGVAEGVHYYEDEGDGWNQVVIRCEGTKIQSIINGVVISDYEGRGILDDAIHRNLKVGTEGRISLQIHKNSENHMRFKDIQIREL